MSNSATAYHYLHTDHLETPVLGTDKFGTQTWKAISEAFGETKAETSSSITMNLRFAGQYFDDESGLHQNYFRDYRPRTGRYIQRDPIGLEGGINTYAYVGGSPLMVSDPSGLVSPTLLRPIVGGGIAVAVAISRCMRSAACVRLAQNAAAAAAASGVVAACMSTYDAVRNWVTSQEANGNPGGEEAPSSGADSGVKIDDKIKGQIGDRGWTEQDVQDAANGPPAGTTTDNRRPNKTADGQGRNDSATVYGTKDGYVVVNDRTREVVQVSDRKPGAGWIPDSRINWNGGN